MPRLLQSLGLLYFLLLFPVLVPAQSYTAKRIVFEHPGGASQAQLEAAAGFHAGDHFTRDDLTAAAQRIADTGFYDNVGVMTAGPANALVVTFALTPANAADFLPAGFENFVWLTQEEITAAIRRKVPLFNGRLPEAGTQADTAAQALTEALVDKRIVNAVTPVGVSRLKFVVTHETVEPTLEHPERVMEFRITSPQIVVSELKLGPVAASLQPLLDAGIRRSKNTAYNEGKGGILTRDLILDPLRDAGYVQAIMHLVSMEVGAPIDGKVPLLLDATLKPGLLFHVSELKFEGTPLYSPAEFTKNAKLHPGDVASQRALFQTLAPLDVAYRNHGYMDVVIDASPDLNLGASTVAYTISVTPGEPYHVHTVTADGLDPAAKADFDKAFALHEGDVYNPGYVATFLSRRTDLKSLARYAGSYKAYAFPATHTVDVVITFSAGGAPAVIVH